ncbi:hypothetical protein immuto35A_132 [Flavobacterium phage vB_FspM_immuto_3-5A]|uniref:Uncharacterized protein n=1 Tax=Flavobacterium phage vB_FspM_immuto_2-6A TaxID=2801477 RepID=A0A7T8ES43_9CAUD|nr:hypothetical protein KNV73_gp138 [Flavobacterium phage vB_FspM_immuto_2-6A]QQO91812.1 hypothetical protein immuto26A_133 [Flavobacterium phage vB_FspM_immuto_2-6A]QQO92050.1 hypothetical protein immuto35A_132 [Flavobacterium phage vB_FspM_immuto_3-5A]QQO92288.1 hypothetical protein immuto136C_132 [Flavobacterium phage vB_FspM_immuto_13-6C]
MKTLLEKAKTLLIVQANDLYDIRKDDLDLDALSFRNHYSNLGELVFQIECYESLGEIVKDLENDNLQELGYWGADEDMIESFLTEILKNK